MEHQGTLSLTAKWGKPPYPNRAFGIGKCDYGPVDLRICPYNPRGSELCGAKRRLLCLYHGPWCQPSASPSRRGVPSLYDCSRRANCDCASKMEDGIKLESLEFIPHGTPCGEQ